MSGLLTPNDIAARTGAHIETVRRWLATLAAAALDEAIG